MRQVLVKGGGGREGGGEGGREEGDVSSACSHSLLKGMVRYLHHIAPVITVTGKCLRVSQV